MRGYYDSLRLLLELACLALPSKDAKEFGLIWGPFQEFSSEEGCTYTSGTFKWGKKFIWKIEVHILSNVPGKQQPLLTFTMYLTVM